MSTRTDADARFLHTEAAAILEEGIATALEGAAPETIALVHEVVLGAPLADHVLDVAAAHGVHMGTLAARVYRAGLPSLARLLAHARLVRFAWLLEDADRTIAEAAELVGLSPTNVARFVLRLTQLAPSEWRGTTRGTREAERFVRLHLLPHASRWRAAQLLDPTPDPAEA